MSGSLAQNLANIQSRIRTAAGRAGRDPAEVTLIAVSKTHPAETVAAAVSLGLTDFGENRVEEAAAKIQHLTSLSVKWHMIGHVQSRKARDVVNAGFTLVHSVDSRKLAERLSRFAAEAGRVQPILLECNVSGEASKSGFAAFDPATWPALLNAFGVIVALPGVRVRGLMTMAPLGADHDSARPCFRRLRELRDAARAAIPTAEWAELSMGMTDDFEGAIAEGATLVRVGRAIFGERA
ncbi:MAG: YggS family pyridoxal phosphate-dependent enzyme [Anaerolineales bacterium]